MFSLTTPSTIYENSYRTYIRELGNSERYPFPLDYPFDDFPALIDRLNKHSSGIDLPDGFVPNSTFWLLENNEIVGVSNLRHEITEKLKVHGGHIGFGVRPTAQKRGIAKVLLRLTLEQAGRLGITEVYVNCLKDNVASSKTIVANGGKLDAEYFVPEYTGIIRRFIIEVSS
jgi:predicted acetyltransferase